jgi:hypothetical protein
MTSRKCDIWKKEIGRGKPEFAVSLDSPGHYIRRTLCTHCGKPIAAFLRRHNLDSRKKARRAA